MENGIQTLSVEIKRDFQPIRAEAKLFGKGDFWAAIIVEYDRFGNTRLIIDKRDRDEGNNVRTEIKAGLACIKAAVAQGIPITLLAVNESTVLTSTRYMEKWKREGWPENNSKENTDLWVEVERLSAQIEVTWVKRPKEELDRIKVYSDLMQALGDLEDELPASKL